MPFLEHAGNCGHNSNPANAGTIAATVTTEILAGQPAFVRVSCYAESLTGGTSNAHSTVTDTVGNTWTKCGEVTGQDSTINVIVSLWRAVLTVTLEVGHGVTATFDTDYRGRVIALDAFQIADDEVGTIEQVDVEINQGSGNTLSVTLPLAELEEVTFVGVGAHAEAQTTVTMDATFTTDRDKIVVNGGTSFGNTSLWGQYRPLETDTETWNASLSTISRAWGMVLAAFRVLPPPPPPAIPGMREYQEDFETDTHNLRRASTTRRPDAVSFDYLTASTMGPVDIDDISQGYRARRWQVQAITAGLVEVRRSNADGSEWEDWGELFTYSGAAIAEISLAFDENGRPVVAMERPTGTSSAPQAWLRWYDPIYPAYMLSTHGNGRTPRVCSDHFPSTLSEHVCPPEINVHLVYLKAGTGMVRYEDSDRFTEEFATPLLASGLSKRFIESFFPTVGERLSVIYGQHNTSTGRYELKRVDTKPFPDSLLLRPRFVNWSDPGSDLFRGDGLWSATPGIEDRYLRVEVSQEVDGIECVAATDYPAGALPTFDQQFQEEVGPLSPTDARDFTFSMDGGGGTLELVAFRARVYRVVGDITCYSAWRYLVLPMAWPHVDVTDPAVNCDRDILILAGARDVWARDGLVEWTRTRASSAGPDFYPTQCPDDPVDGDGVVQIMAGGLENHEPSFPFPTHTHSFGVRRRAVESLDFYDEDGHYVGVVAGAVMESTGAGTPPPYTLPDSRFPRQFPNDQGEFAEGSDDPPAEGEFEWEDFGTEINEAPEPWELPEPERAYYDDPQPLNGVGSPAEFVAREFGESLVRAVRVRQIIEAELRHPHVYGVALLDSILVPEIGAPCSVVVEVYQDDRETPWFSVGTDPDHLKPYLVEPDRYGEQEIDVAAGAATIGTVQVVIIDPAIVPGDQDTGWLTKRLGISGFGNIQGRRCRVRRFISEALGWQTIADGPASAPRMDSSYAAFSLDVRDTRESERKIRAFDVMDNQNLVPEVNGYGFNPESNAWLIDPPFPAYGRSDYFTGFGLGFGRYIVFDVSGTYTVSLEAFKALLEIVPGGPGAHHPWVPGTRHPAHFTNRSRMVFQWRIKDSADPWTYISETLYLIPTHVLGTDPQAQDQELWLLHVESPDDESLLPADGDIIEFLIRGPIAPSAAHPGYVEGLTAGELTKNLYDGLYSPPDAAGNLQSTGIRYDEAAVLQMADPVRLRLTEPISDLRNWLETHIYAPTGWVPALDRDGRISPVSQIAPVNGDGLPAITNAITEPSPDWSAGDRIVNVLRFVYPRDYKPADPEGTDPDGLLSREVVREYRDPVSIERMGEQAIEYDGSAFRSLGDPDGNPQIGDPLGAAIAALLGAVPGNPNEEGMRLAADRWRHVLNRYAYGAPTTRVNVMRSAIPTMRCGAWAVLDLSWFPDYVTRKRGLVSMAQVVAVADLDCAWRGLTLEVVIPIIEGSS